MKSLLEINLLLSLLFLFSQWSLTSSKLTVEGLGNGVKFVHS